MTNEEFALEIAKGIGETHVEGFYNSVSESTIGDYPSMGISQWEGISGRGDRLLGEIEGGVQFAGRAYSDIKANEGIDALKEVLGSESGIEAQNRILAEDCLEKYVPVLLEVLTDTRCIIYAGVWCPTNHELVQLFLQHRAERGYDINNLETLRDLFYNEYTTAADLEDVPGVLETYQNRAVDTYNYVSALPIA